MMLQIDSNRDTRPHQIGMAYPTMSVEDIAGLDVAGMAADDCHLFVWTTQRFLYDTPAIVQAWGFRPICTFVWHKNGGYQPINLPQFNCEFVLYC
ncbi:MAG: MT-A70 family methyltransferase, partial [Pseudonocardiaceae bacterium]